MSSIEKTASFSTPAVAHIVSERREYKTRPSHHFHSHIKRKANGGLHVHSRNWKYNITDRIATGGFSKVYFAERQGIFAFQRRSLAIKVINMREEFEYRRAEKKPLSMTVRSALRELDMLDYLQGSPYVVKLYDGFIVEDPLRYQLYIVMEYVQFSLQDLLDYLEENRRKLHIEELASIAVNVLRGMRFIHKKKLIHKDIKPENVLISDKGYLKLCDFGISQLFEPTKGKKSKDSPGTGLYMAPELLYNGEHYDNLVDVWSFGIVMYLLQSGYEPPGYMGEDYFGFRNWKSYEKGEDAYYYDLLGRTWRNFPENNEYVGHVKRFGTKQSSKLSILDSKGSFLESFIRECLVPQPKYGPSGPYIVDGVPEKEKYPELKIIRDDLRDRATVSELLNSSFIRTYTGSEHLTRQRIKGLYLTLLVQDELKIPENLGPEM